MSQFGLHCLSSEELKRTLRALHRSAFSSPITRSSLIEKGFGNIEGHLDACVGRDVESAKAMIVAVLAERGKSNHGTAQLVYMGAVSAGTRSKDLLVQVRELLTSTVSRVEIYGVRPEEGRGLLRTLASVCEGRDVPMRVVFDASGVEGDARARLAQVEAAIAQNFRHATKLEAWMSADYTLSMRALCVDASVALVTSGELHGVEDDARIELGVLLRDPAYIAALDAEWQRLLGSSSVHRVNLPRHV